MYSPSSYDGEEFKIKVTGSGQECPLYTSNIPQPQDVLVAIVVVLVPIALGVPAVVMLVPPAVVLAPATLAGLVQFSAFVIGLSAVASMALDGAMEVVLAANDSVPAMFVTLGVKPRHCGEQHGRRQGCCRKQGLQNGRNLVRTIHEVYPSWLGFLIEKA
jgi:hypothetical protein